MADLARFPLIQLVGPTASGKTAWSLKIAEAFSAEVVNFDSVLMHQGLDVGSAKPTLIERQKIVHWMVDVVQYPDSMTAGRFKEMASSIIRQELSRCPLILSGGSGFYLKALQTPMRQVAEVSAEAQSRMDEQEHREGLSSLHRWLEQVAPELAKKIHPNDRYRVRRHLGLVLTHGQDQLKLSSESTWSFGTKKIGLLWDRDQLRQRAKLRVRQMLKSGLVEEIEALKRQWGEEVLSWKPLQSIGYNEGLQYLRGELKKEDLADAILRSTMALAKRQMTWFKKDPEVEWSDGQVEEDQLIEKVRKLWFEKPIQGS